jgi:hypothetical protein
VFAQRAAVLLRDADRLRPFLRHAGLVHHQDAVRRAERLRDEALQLVPHGVGVPDRLVEQPLRPVGIGFPHRLRLLPAVLAPGTLRVPIQQRLQVGPAALPHLRPVEQRREPRVERQEQRRPVGQFLVYHQLQSITPLPVSPPCAGQSSAAAVL